MTWDPNATSLIVFVLAWVIGAPVLVLMAMWLSWPEDAPSMWHEFRTRRWRR